jgi:hypothetical protein
MKMRAIVTPSLFLAFGLLLGTTAHAQDVKGTIKVAGANTGSLTFKCDDMVVEAFSEEQTKPPPGYKGLWFSTPKWHRQAKATGSWSGGSCSYSVKVVAKSKFAVILSTDRLGSWDICDVSSTPPQAGWFKVSPGETKDQDFTLDAISCSNIK